MNQIDFIITDLNEPDRQGDSASPKKLMTDKEVQRINKNRTTVLNDDESLSSEDRNSKAAFSFDRKLKLEKRNKIEMTASPNKSSHISNQYVRRGTSASNKKKKKSDPKRASMFSLSAVPFKNSPHVN